MPARNRHSKPIKICPQKAGALARTVGIETGQADYGVIFMTYCISDIHGCYDEFMELVEKIDFSPTNDTIYILGDAIDRGSNSVDCLRFIKKTKGVHLLMGNHEQMMLDFYDGKDLHGDWYDNGGIIVEKQLGSIDKAEFERILSYVRKRPYYKTVKVNERRFFLSHAGLDFGTPFMYQPKDALLWSRDRFIRHEAIKGYVCVFGHTPTPYMHGMTGCSVWFDDIHKDKICIDSACVFGGALAALRLDDGEVFYVVSKSKNESRKFTIDQVPHPENFLQTDKAVLHST